MKNKDPFSWSRGRVALLAAGLLALAGAAYALPTNPDPCHTAACTPWPGAVANPATDGHQHRDPQNLFDVMGAYKTYAVWDDNVYQYNAGMDRSIRMATDMRDFGHGFINRPPRYRFDNNAAAMTDVPLWARPLIGQVIDQWAAAVNELGANTNGVATETKIQFQQVVQGEQILIRFANTYPARPAAGGGWEEWEFPYDPEIEVEDYYQGRYLPNQPMPGGGAPQGGRSGVLAYWTPALRVLTFNRRVNWYQDTGNPMMDKNPMNQPDKFDFYTTALHEWGHVLGLDHPMNAGIGTTMHSTQGRRNQQNGIIRDIDNGSLDGAKNLYTIARCPPPAGGGGGGCEFCPACNSCCPAPEPCPICPICKEPVR